MPRPTQYPTQARMNWARLAQWARRVGRWGVPSDTELHDELLEDESYSAWLQHKGLAMRQAGRLGRLAGQSGPVGWPG